MFLLALHAAAAVEVTVITPAPGPVWFTTDTAGNVVIVPRSGASDALVCTPAACSPLGKVRTPAEESLQLTDETPPVRLGAASAPDLTDPARRRILVVSATEATVASPVLAQVPWGPQSHRIVGLYDRVHPDEPVLGKYGKPSGTVGPARMLGSKPEQLTPYAVTDTPFGTLVAFTRAGTESVWLYRADAADASYLKASFVNPLMDTDDPDLYTGVLGQGLVDMDLGSPIAWVALGKYAFSARAADGSTALGSVGVISKDATGQCIAWVGDHLLVGTSAGLYEGPPVTDKNALRGDWERVTKARDVRRITVDGDVWWLATDKGVVLRDEAGVAATFGVKQGLPSDDVLDVFVDAAHRAWVSDRAGNLTVLTR